MADVHDALHSYLGSRYIGQFFKYGRAYQINIQSEQSQRDLPEDLLHIHVQNNKGRMVPLGTLVDIHPTIGPSLIEHYNLYRSASISGQPTPDSSTEGSMKAMEQIARELPLGYDFEWSGLSLQQRESGQWTATILLLAALFAYLFLVAQFESWLLPLAVMASVPFSLTGAMAGLHLSGLDNNIYTQLGLILLIALAAKNAILIVEFARQREAMGDSCYDAALTAARLRFRPVLMTALSFIFGVIPLIISSGAGAIARKSLGTPVFWGMLSVAIFSTLLTPSLYLVITRVRNIFHQA